MSNIKDSRRKMLGDDPVEKVVVKLAVPAIIGMLVTAIYNIVDTIFVGQLGQEALGAATVALPIFTFISAIGLMYGIGSSSYISRLLGANKKEEAEKTLTTSLILTIVTAFSFSILSLLFLERILVIFGASDAILPLAKEYTQVLIIGGIATMINMNLNNTLRAEGSAKISMIALSTGALLNIVLDPLLIFTFDMGIKGAAIATVLSQVISTVILLTYYIRSKSLLELDLGKASLDPTIVKEIYIMGTPALLRQSLISLSMGFWTKAASNYGISAVAALGIITRVYMFGLYILLGYTQGFLPVAGFNFGSKQYDRLLLAIKVTLKNTAIFCITLTIVYIGFAESLSKLFVNEPEVIEIATKGIRYFSILMPFLGFIMTFNNLFQAIGYATIAMILSIARQGVFLIPAILLLPKRYGLEGVLLSQTIADALTLVTTIFFAVYIIRKIKKMKSNYANDLSSEVVEIAS